MDVVGVAEDDDGADGHLDGGGVGDPLVGELLFPFGEIVGAGDLECEVVEAGAELVETVGLS